MTIGKLENSSASATALKPEVELDNPTQGDADWFRAAMQRPEPTQGAGAFSEQVMDPLTRKALSLEDMSRDAGKALREASLHSDPKKFMEATRALSDYSLQTSLSVKMISKGSQALDKLTNMQ
ncbi:MULTISPECIES: type III secretion system inner rod subunit SctI [Pseudomonas]|uniref:Type III secretion system inner rod subunit SctI n=1 Tax=Pseudomonas phytophila TaxID=2867264 RepID=A0ABY6FAN3_9PSED|nr:MULTISPECIES: type III secretion system inner rod subunit SctI [Pseudomonas]MCQ2996781.1 type III secretion system inner rod subunit SctI [Pseudomonas syringae]MCD5973733.1 type III secretion system inner rod subunit SctI [Pseudomonas quasicaspiana]MCD5987099.1 type III secretion system inner rod subunit SctI [Pseudomonas quasicaspiana]MCQ3003041.1 type III secretion system inner rod subunit SctI [Pseudomonas syringae]MDG6399237.1 type III secretion system inner rod subunit SctI [Pseudomona